MRIITLAPLVAALPAAAFAGPLTFDGAVARALATGPSLEARALDVQARAAALPAAGQLPDPRIGVGIDNYPISGPPAFSLAEDSMTMGRISLMQDVPNAAKRRARTVRARADVGEAEAQADAEQRRIRVETAVAWIDTHYAERRLRAVEQQIVEVDRLAGPATTGVASGGVRPAQALDIRRAAADLADRRDSAVADLARARAALTRWTGDSDSQVIGSAPGIEVNPDALRRSIDALPGIAIQSARLRQAEADVELARADKRPDFGVEVAYQKRADRYGDMVSAGVTIGLPLFARRRQDPVIAARTASATAVRADQEDVRRALQAELDAALADHAMHHAQWIRARDTLLPLARQRVDLERASYGAGRASLLDVIEARTALLENDLQALEREAIVARDGVRLNMTYGSEAR